MLRRVTHTERTDRQRKGFKRLSSGDILPVTPLLAGLILGVAAIVATVTLTKLLVIGLLVAAAIIIAIVGIVLAIKFR